jgi:hypothetical protein
MLTKIEAKGEGTMLDQSPRYLKHLKRTTQRCPRAFNYKHLVELVNHLDVWIFEWGKGLVVLAYLKETQKGANIGKRKGA